MRIYTAAERDLIRVFLNDQKDQRVLKPEEFAIFEACVTILSLLDHIDSMEESHAYAMRHDP